MKKIKKKKRRSDTKIITREATVLKVMRESRKLSMRRAAVLVGVSDTFINHLEHGRLDLNPEIINRLLIAYGYSCEEFIKFQDPKNDLPEAIRHECLEIVRILSYEKLKTVKAILQSF